jgi:hypothetical protein
MSGMLALAAASALFVPGAGPAFAASVTLNMPSCTAFTIADNGNGTYSLNCSTAPTAPGSPTNCVVTATTVPSPLTSGGGTVNLGVTCAGTTANTTWAWTRNSTPIGSAATASDTLPANTSTSAVPYSYTVQACNGTACTSAGTTVSVPGVGGPVTPPPPPPPGGISCPGFSKTMVLNLPWQTTTVTTRIKTTNNGGLSANDALVIVIDVPAGVASTASGSITIGEWGGGPFVRFATLSQTACDFNKSNWFVDTWTGSSINPTIKVGGAPQAYVALLQPGQRYYLNVRNTDRFGVNYCLGESHCNMFIDFLKPPGT